MNRVLCVSSSERITEFLRDVFGHGIADFNIIRAVGVAGKIYHANHRGFDAARVFGIIFLSSGSRCGRSSGRYGSRCWRNGRQRGLSRCRNNVDLARKTYAAAFVFVFKLGQVAFIKDFSQSADDFGIQRI